MAPTLHSNENGRENTFFTERRHSEQSGVGLTGSYETPRIAQAEVRQKCANSILVRVVPKGLCAAACAQGAGGGGAWRAVRRLGARGRGMPQGERSCVYWKPKGAAAKRASPCQPTATEPVDVLGPMLIGGL